MKKILSILLALSIACGSVMLTSCGDDAKEDDDDKSVSDKERDEDEDDEDKDDEDESSEDDDKDDEDDEKSDDDESSKDGDKDDEDDEKSDDDESSKDDKDDEDDEKSDDESSKDDDKDDEDDEKSDDDSSEDDDDDNAADSADGTYVAGDTVALCGVSFVVPEHFTCEISDGAAVFTSEDELSLETINIQTAGADDASIYTQETFDELYESLYPDMFTSDVYEVGTLGDADTVYYSSLIDMDLFTMKMIQYCIFTDDASVIVTAGYMEGGSDANINEFIDSFEVL